MPRAKKTKETIKESPKAKTRYFEGIGRRKTAIARVRILPGKTEEYQINKKTLVEYFQQPEYQKVATEALKRLGDDKKFEVSVLITGGGRNAQAEAMRHGLARALVLFDSELRPQMKTLGFLTRDPRMKERKKFGLRGARRARQWRKR